MGSLIAKLKTFDTVEIVLLLAIVFVAVGTGTFLAVTGMDSDSTYDDKMAEANLYLEERDYDRAESIYLEVIEIAPRKPEPYLKVADIRVIRMDFQGVVDILIEGKEKTGDEEAFDKRLEAAEEMISEDWKEAYRQVLKKHKDEILQYRQSEYTDKGDTSATALCDLNGDGRPELLFFIAEENGYGNGQLLIYTYDGEKAVGLDYPWSDHQEGDDRDGFIDAAVAGGYDYIVYTEKTTGKFGIYTTITDENIMTALNRYEMDGSDDLDRKEWVNYYFNFIEYGENGEYISSSETVDFDEAEYYSDGKESTKEDFMSSYEESRDDMDQVIFAEGSCRGDDQEIWDMAEKKGELSKTYDQMMKILKPQAKSDDGEKKTDTGSQDDELFGELAGKTFIFSAGVGGWATEMEISEDGSFQGVYTDGDLGDTEDGTYPNGTTYNCVFSGKFKNPEKVGDYEYTLTLDGDMEFENEPGTDDDVEGMHMVYTEPYGLEGLFDGDTLTVMAPGYPLYKLTEDEKGWITGLTGESSPPDNAEDYYLKNDESIFVPM